MFPHTLYLVNSGTFVTIGEPVAIYYYYHLNSIPFLDFISFFLMSFFCFRISSGLPVTAFYVMQKVLNNPKCIALYLSVLTCAHIFFLTLNHQSRMLCEFLKCGLI